MGRQPSEPYTFSPDSEILENTLPRCVKIDNSRDEDSLLFWASLPKQRSLTFTMKRLAFKTLDSSTIRFEIAIPG